MAASKYDFAIEQGTSFKISLIYKDANGIPVNLTNWCARLIWKTNTGQTYSFNTTDPTDGVYSFSIDGINGKLTLMFPAIYTNSFNFTSAKYDLELQSPDDLYAGGGKYTTRILFGTISIVKRFSQSNDALECSV
jgi:hypothetical protein